MDSQRARPNLEPTPVAELPEAAVACILQHVPLKQRLSCCMLVCRAWAALAASLPAHVEADVADSKFSLKLNKQAAASQFNLKWQMHLGTWLASKCGQQTVSINLSDSRNAPCYGRRPTQLPFQNLPHLTSLQLTKVWLHLPPGAGPAPVGPLDAPSSSSSSSSSDGSNGGSTGDAAAQLPQQLQSLRLQYCPVPAQLLLELAKVTGLTQLHVVECVAPYGDLGSPVNPNAHDPIGWLGYRNAAGVPQLLQQLPSLTDLHLCNQQFSRVEPAVAGMEPIGRMQHLQRLTLSAQESIAEILTSAAALPASLTYLKLEQSQAAAVRNSACFGYLTNLRQLRMSGVSISSSTLAGLTTLQHLRLHLPDFADAPEPLAALPASLTYLELDQSEAAALRNSAGFGWLTKLRQLRMSGIGISSSTLASLTTLQHLRLHLQEFADAPEASTGQLLTALQALEQLEHLELTYAGSPAPPRQQQQQQQLPAAALPPPNFGADDQQAQQPVAAVQQAHPSSLVCITALPTLGQLTALHISQSCGQPLPFSSILDSMLQPGRVLRQLRVLRLERAAGPAATHDRVFARYGTSAYVYAKHIKGLARSCPALQALTLGNVTSATFDVGCLRQLPAGLTSLNLLGVSMLGAEAGQLAQVTQLRSLKCSCSTADAQLQLTALRGLTELELYGPTSVAVIAPWVVRRIHLLSSQEAEGPDVYEQLQRLLMKK